MSAVLLLVIAPCFKMRTRIHKILFGLTMLVAAFGSLLVGRVTAQTFRTLHNFSSTNPTTGANTDGATPLASLILSNNVLYGTTSGGGTSARGTVFALNIDGTGFKTLHSFTSGAEPNGRLLLVGDTLYGTTAQGGSSGNGTVFKININGAGFATVFNFAGGSAGANPLSDLTLSDGALYGTASGLYTPPGAVFKMNTNGSSFSLLHDFASDGARIYTGLTLSTNILYGATWSGGDFGLGSVFAVHTDGTGFTTLYSFADVNSDGGNLFAGLVLRGNILYGTTFIGGSLGKGTIFAINIDGTGFMTLYNFSGDSDGGLPEGDLTLSGNTLYGTTSRRAADLSGTVFAINTDGTGFTNLYSFTPISSPNFTNSDGASPDAGLVIYDNTLYGTASGGGRFSSGTVFALALEGASPPQLDIVSFGPGVILSWRTNFIGYTLQSASNLVSPEWTTNGPSPVLNNGLYTVTNLISNTQRFFRLAQ